MRKEITSCAVLLWCAQATAAPTTYRRIWQFYDGPTGGNTNAGVIQDASGALYGTTPVGGRPNVFGGTVFKLTPPTAGETKWHETTLWAFSYADGVSADGPLLMDKSGALYGTTSNAGGQLFGSLFKLTPPAAGQTGWSFEKLWAFNGRADGGEPVAGLVMDEEGALYGTTSIGGRDKQGSAHGTVFRLSPPSQFRRRWDLKTLHYFYNAGDGDTPGCTLLRDAAGALYGTTVGGGAYNYGTAFKLTPPARGDGAWQETLIWNFTGKVDGAVPFSGLVADAQGALYGATFGSATVFKLIPPANGQGAWSERTLFQFDGANGEQLGGLTQDGTGGFYGTALIGGLRGGGTVYQVRPPRSAQGSWSERTLHAFGQSGESQPIGNILVGAGGTLYGTTFLDGRYYAGGIFTLTMQ